MLDSYVLFCICRGLCSPLWLLPMVPYALLFIVAAAAVFPIMSNLSFLSWLFRLKIYI
jgi:hypothetical protein